MNERRGYVVLIRHGDPEISGGIAEALLGATEGKGTTSSDPASGRATYHGPTRPRLAGNSALCCFPSARRPRGGRLLETALPSEQVETVEAEIDRQRIQRALLRVAVGNHKSNEDYDAMITKARGDYGRAPGREGPMRRVGDALLGLYGLMVYGIARAYRAQDALLGGGRAS